MVVFTPVNEENQRELTAVRRKTFLLAIIIGAVGMLAYVVLRTFIESPVLDVMLIFAVPFGVGLVLYLVLDANIKQPAQKNYVNRFEFNDETLDIATMRHDEVIAAYKLHYNEIVKVKETEKYYFVYIAKFSAYIISKENLTEDEKNKINKLLKISNQHKQE